MAWMATCIGLLVAIAFIGVGATVVRKAHPTSGYLFIGAGLLELLMRCCNFGTNPRRLLENDIVDYDVVRPLIMGMRVLNMVEWLIVGVMLAMAFVGLARALRATK